MLDTVILEIPIQYRAVIDPTKFNPPARVFEAIIGFLKCTNNPKAADRKKGIYKPKLTIIKRAKELYLKIEFSAPKLLFGNNLEEIGEGDFEEVVNKLRATVQEMGVMLWTRQIEEAKVVGFHPSKNIVLTNGYTASFAIRELSKIDLSKKMDIERVGFRNDGEALQFYSNRHSVVFYDKINDLTKPSKRAIDKDQIGKQKHLFDSIRREVKHFEVLRFEIRISHRDKLEEILQKTESEGNPTFKDIFKKDLCQKILRFYWESLFGGNIFLFNAYNHPQRILQMTLMKYPKTKMKTAVMLIGLYLLCKDDEGVRGFRQIVDNYRKTDWNGLRRYLKRFEDDFYRLPMHGFMKDIEENLDRFEAFRLTG